MGGDDQDAGNLRFVGHRATLPAANRALVWIPAAVRDHGRVEAAPFDARELVGLLASDDRRRVFAALVLGASNLDDIRRAAGLDVRSASRALQRFIDAGLVVTGDDGLLHLLEAAFDLAARAEAARNAPPDEHSDQPKEVARVMRAFVRDGRLLSIPTSHSKRLVILDWLAQRFEPGERYSEPQVNLILGQVHADTAALRRYLVDDEFLTREHGQYWRSGGTFAPGKEAAD
jgi:hypothetical protein